MIATHYEFDVPYDSTNRVTGQALSRSNIESRNISGGLTTVKSKVLATPVTHKISTYVIGGIRNGHNLNSRGHILRGYGRCNAFIRAGYYYPS